VKTYLTEYLVLNEVGRPVKWCGPRIDAETLEQAEQKAEEMGMGLTVLGEFMGEVEWEDMPDGLAGAMRETADQEWLEGGPKE